MAKKDKQHNKEIKDLLNALNKSVGEVVNGHVGQVLLINETNQRVAFFGAEMSATLQNIFKAMQNQTDFMTREASEAEFRADVAKKGGIQPIEVTVEGDEKAVEAAEGEKKKTTVFLSKIGGMFAGAGMGAAGAIAAVGIAAAGIALVVMSITKLIEVMSNLDAGMIKDKVVTLLSISGEIEKDGKSFIGEGAKFFLAMVGIGLGLLVFGLGAGVAGLTIRLVKEGFAEKVLHIVSKLMEIPDKLGGAGKALADGGVFLAVMLGIGLGLLVFGLGQAVASLTIRLAEEQFAEKVVHIVTTLMGIPAALGGHAETLKAGGTFTLIMMGIGVGLAVFGAGLTIAALVVELTDSGFAQKVVTIVKSLMEVPAALGDPKETASKIVQFTAIMLGIGAGLLVFGAGLGLSTLVSGLVKEGFAQGVVDTVTTLLSITELFTGMGDAFVKGGTFIVAMLGIAIGLYIFAAGSIAMSIGTLVGGNFAQNVVDTVTTLLSLNDIVAARGGAFKEGGLFIVTMLGIAAGLFLFGAGAAVGGVVQALVGGDFAPNVVKTVKTLLSIKDELGGAKEAFGDTGSFLIIMAGIAAGLLVFSLGEAAAGISSFIGDAGTGGKGIAESIRDKVTTLMDVARNVKMEDVTNLQTVLTGMRDAIKKFTGGFKGAVGDALTQTVGNIGKKGNDPMGQILEFARSADELDRGTTALERLGKALNTISGSGTNNNLQQFATNLKSVAESLSESLDEMLAGKGIPATRTRALEALAAVNIGSEGFSAMRDAAAVGTQPTIINNNTSNVSSSGGTTNIINGAGIVDTSLLSEGRTD